MNRAAPSPERPAWTFLIVALYLAAALPLAWLSRFQLNPDGVAYVEHARHWARGEVALAVSSWWGPLLSWLLVPFVWMRVDPVFATKLLDIGFGLIFAAGVRAIVRNLTGGFGTRMAFVGGLLLALNMLPELLTPDLLLTCVLTWYVAVGMQLFQSDTVATAARTGLIGGLAYLAKAYALPYVAAHLTMTMALKLWLKNRAAPAMSLKQYAVALAAFGLVSAPWVTAISVQDGKVTIGSAGRHWSAWSFLPAPKPRPAYQELQLPREGRLTTWENPVEVRHPWSLWSPFDGATGVRYQLVTIKENLWRLPQYVDRADVWGLLPVGFIAAIVFLLPLRETLKTDDGILRAWVCLSVALYVAGYVLIIVLPRYLWPIRGLLLALAIAGPGVAWSRALGDARTWAGRTFARWHRALLVVLLVSIGLSVVGTFNEWRGPWGRGAVYAGWKHAGEAFAGGCRFAATHYASGLFVTYWARGVYVGQVAERTPEDIARALSPFGGVTLLVADDPALAATLASSAMFTRIELASPVVRAFGVAGGGCPAARTPR